jgi:hypothetical protein
VELQRGGNSRRIALAIARVIRAAAGNVFALRRLRKLPDLGKWDAALGWAWRMFWQLDRKSVV